MPSANKTTSDQLRLFLQKLYRNCIFCHGRAEEGSCRYPRTTARGFALCLRLFPQSCASARYGFSNTEALVTILRMSQRPDMSGSI